MKNVLSVIIMAAAFICGMAAEIDYLTRENTAWRKAEMEKKKEVRIVDQASGEPGQMRFVPSASTESLKWSSKPISIPPAEQLLLEYKALPGTGFTIDVSWDKGKLSRVLRRKEGDGEWQRLSLPVKGKTLVLIMSVTPVSAALPEECQVSLKPLSTQDTAAVAVNAEWLVKPLLMPAPKELNNHQTTITFNKLGVCLNGGKEKIYSIIAEELSRELKTEVKSADTPDELGNCDTVVELAILPEPQYKEGYRIEFSRKDHRNFIRLTGDDRAGLYWAWQTLRQLRDGSTFHSCAIRDWPDLPFRALLAGSVKSAEEIVKMKFNRLCFPWWTIRASFRDFTADSDKLKAKYEELRKMCTWALDRGIDVMLHISPFEEKPPFVVSDDAQIEELFAIYDQFMRLGVRSAWAWIDDTGRNPLAEADKKAYGDDKLLCHAWFVKRFSERIWRSYPDAEIGTVTLKYWGTEGIKGYFDRIGVSKKVITGWPGPQVATLEYREADVKKYEEGIEGRNFFIGENIVTMTHGMYRNLIVAESHAEGYRSLAASPKFVGGRANLTPENQLRKTKSMQVADFYWNARGYNAERTRQQAIAIMVGAKAVEPLIRFSESYLKLAYKYPVDQALPGTKANDPSFRAKGMTRPVIGRKVLRESEVQRYAIDENDYRLAMTQLKDAQDWSAKFEATSNNPIFSEEVAIMTRNAGAMIDYLYRNQKALPEFKDKLEFDINNIPGGTHYKDRGNGKIGCALYGQLTPYKQLEAVFNTNNREDAYLTVEARNCDKNLATVRFELNGHKIFEGISPFGEYPEWKKIRYCIPAGYFQKGRNVLKIINLSPYSDFLDHWIIITGLVFDK